MKIDKILNEIEEMGDAHASGSAETPLREDAFEISDSEKIEKSGKMFAISCIRWALT